MGITREDVLHVAKLASLELTEEEIRRLEAQLNDILAAVGKVSELDLSDVPPTSHPLAVVNVLRPDEPRPSPMVSVAIAPPKGDRLAWAVQKLTEVGVDEVVLLRTERSVRGWDAARADRALERLRTIAREAAMQSHRPFLMDVVGIASFDEALARHDDPTVLFDMGGPTCLSDALPAAASNVRLLVGPEGGFTAQEVATAVGTGGVVTAVGMGGTGVGPTIVGNVPGPLVDVAVAVRPGGGTAGVGVAFLPNGPGASVTLRSTGLPVAASRATT